MSMHSEQLFDLTSPDDPDWSAWGAKIADSDLAYDLFGCLQPD
ncbi:hypothetical protein [Aeromicrobium wangtongii]|nr:hypothetical protein [Aeromicrobium wangtongii]